MRRPLGQTLLLAGAAVCALGAVGLGLGMFLTIPEALAWKIARAVSYAAPFLVGGTLMLCGTLLLRAARRAGRDADERAREADARPATRNAPPGA